MQLMQTGIDGAGRSAASSAGGPTANRSHYEREMSVSPAVVESRSALCRRLRAECRSAQAGLPDALDWPDLNWFSAQR